MRTIFLCTAALIFSTVSVAQAASFSFTGSFSFDDDVQVFGFHVGAPSTVTLRSYSYAGGTMADGTGIAAGGFDPILALFDGSGNLINQNDDGYSVPADPETGLPYDTLLTLDLGVGDYFASVMQFDNFAPSRLSLPFLHDGEHDFTAAEGCSNAMFCDAGGNNRSSAWAFDILNVDSAITVDPQPSAVPLPAGLPLVVSALGGMALLRRRRK